MLKQQRYRIGDSVASRSGTALFVVLLACVATGYSAGRGLAAEEAARTPQSAADRQYRACLDGAVVIHDNAHAAECKRLAERADSDRANCLAKLNLPKIYCDASYGPRDPAATCTLPDEVATVIDAELSHARFRCARTLKGEGEP
jgi:hypothetical protein